MLRIVLAVFAVLAMAVPFGAVSAAELPARVVVKKGVVAVERVEIWGPCWRRRLPFYDITDPDWIRPMCLQGTRAVYVR